MHPHCMNPMCEECSFFTPRVFGIRVPKSLGLALFKLEGLLNTMIRF
jgi:hypothetical protein